MHLILITGTIIYNVYRIKLLSLTAVTKAMSCTVASISHLINAHMRIITSAGICSTLLAQSFC